METNMIDPKSELTTVLGRALEAVCKAAYVEGWKKDTEGLRSVLEQAWELHREALELAYDAGRDESWGDLESMGDMTVH